MTAPKRVQLSRKKGWRMPPNTVRVDRATRFGNPFRVTEYRTAAEACMDFETWLLVPGCDAGMQERRERILMALPELRGKDLACWCKPGDPCHADVLLVMANAALGLAEDSDSDVVEAALMERFDVTFDQFHRIAEVLMRLTPPAAVAITGELMVGFVKDGSFICKAPA